MRIWHMRILSWVPKAKNTHSEYVILVAPLQQWLHERASILRYTYIAVLVCSNLLSTASICGNLMYWKNVIIPFLK
jgi:hypothetical protein